MDAPGPALPVLAHREDILAAIGRGPLILGAPPGTGKSTQVPRFLLGNPGRILVLQPRRIAARNLALRVAEEMGGPVGAAVGYQVRFEGRSGQETRILFQTYGVFFQQLLADPFLRGVGAVVLDEFHERTLEADATLAWLKALRSTARPDLRLVVMSATLDTEALGAWLSAGSDRAEVLNIPGKAYPVEVTHQAPSIHEPLGNQALRALKKLLARGLPGSVLVFMPGQGEIRRVMEALDPLCRQEGLGLFELHGSMDAEAQQRALRAPSKGTCVIVSTNVAETSLTIPGIAAVIDSGLARISSFSAQRDMNTLYLGSISLQNAVQRAGRAGRTAPGVCIRLWTEDRERGMAPSLSPEVQRVEPTSLLLSLHALLSGCASAGASLGMKEGEKGYMAGYPGYSGRYLVDWLTPPAEALWEKAEKSLVRIGAVAPAAGAGPTAAEGESASGAPPVAITPVGRELVRFPAHPVLARVLLDAGRAGAGPVAAAMVAILESQGRKAKASTADLYALGSDLASDPDARHWDRDTREGFRQLLRLLSRSGPAAEAGRAGRAGRDGEDASADPREAATAPWMVPFQDRIAVRMEGAQSFQLADGRKGVVEAGQLPADRRVILALELHETGGGNQARQVGIPVLLPCEAAWVDRAFPGECRWTRVGGWDEARGRVIQEEHLLFRGLALEKRSLQGASPDPEESARLLADKLSAGEIVLPGFDEEAKQLQHRIRLAAKVFPDYGLPKLDEEDWRLIYDEICHGKASEKDLEGVSVSRALRDYLGPALMAFVDRAAPTSLKLPGGRQGRLTYFENAPPELSARLGDFIGMEGRTAVLEGKVEVIYDILAPNYRTVQKTADLTGFWKNTYPEVKKELKRRYPKHPWP
jgi:ATP-dependent helicase HrpB